MKLGWIGLVVVGLALAVAYFPEEPSETDTEMSWNASGPVGAVAAGDSRAVAAGIEILREGGNAADAAVAVILALSVTDYGQYCIGGEVPFLIYDVRREAVEVLSGQGAAPKLATLEHFGKIGGHPPGRGPRQSAVGPRWPAVIDLCVTRAGAVRHPNLRLQAVQACAGDPGRGRGILAPETGRNATAPGRGRKSRPREGGSRGCAPCPTASTGETLPQGAGCLVPEARRTAAEGGPGRPPDLGGEAGHHRLPGLYRLQGRGPGPRGPIFPKRCDCWRGTTSGKWDIFSADYIHVVTEAMKLAPWPTVIATMAIHALWKCRWTASCRMSTPFCAVR